MKCEAVAHTLIQLFRVLVQCVNFFTPQYRGLPELLCRLAKGLSVTLALDVQLAVVDPNELEDRDFAMLSELTFLVLFVAVLLQSAIISSRGSVLDCYFWPFWSKMCDFLDNKG